MFRLQHIDLYQYKNHSKTTLEFTKNILCITGKNGIGKTNLLDAIYYLCFTKSYFHSQDIQVQMHNTLGMKVEGVFEKSNGTYAVKCILRETGKKEIYCDNELYQQFSKHIGKFPAVMIAPDDIELISGTSELRRRFLDTMLCQIDENYLQYLAKYNKVLLQRNSFLKQHTIHEPIDIKLLDIYNQQLHDFATYIHDVRSSYCVALNKEFIAIYNAICNNTKESVVLQYQSSLTDTSMHTLLSKNFEKDRITQRTNGGIHKDELAIFIKHNIAKTEASQGQRKSILYALKLAQHCLLEKYLKCTPLLLLDDIFEKLDSERIKNLIKYISTIKVQLFITDTNAQQLLAAFLNTEDIQQIEL